VVVESPDFAADARAAGLGADEVRRMVDHIARRPAAGDPIPGTGGARKVRFAGRGKGKSGGYRIITYFGGEDVPVFMLAALSKGETANLSKAERNELKTIVSGIGDDYRARLEFKIASKKRT